MGGDVIVSFGGAANHELAEVITSATALQAAYQSMIDAYGLTHIDFDIEGAAVADRAVSIAATWPSPDCSKPPPPRDASWWSLTRCRCCPAD